MSDEAKSSGKIQAFESSVLLGTWEDILIAARSATGLFCSRVKGFCESGLYPIRLLVVAELLNLVGPHDVSKFLLELTACKAKGGFSYMTRWLSEASHECDEHRERLFDALRHGR
ncbi:hypothetical protein LOAG_00789 [Loa loa]|uniref:Uncharacterized protein n=1 Tax=Loa loa TaxID=7209 RepID=A0A1S0UAY3_LOALO|nr:hypothetical protein LOAG_00789 [Loa loa]EFO27694.1 hypothetical protein LOAG_00789 [Loa loa]